MIRPIVAAFSMVGAFVGAPAFAQPQSFAIPPGILDDTRRLGDNSLRFCINAASSLADLDRALATAIADVLLLDAELYEVVSPFAIPPYDFRIPYPERELYIIINNNCDAFMGVRLSAGNIPDWMTISQPYFSARAVIATTDPAIDSFADLRHGMKISSRMAAPGDINLTAYLRSLPEDQRPSRIPYPDYGLALERLLDGSVQATFTWEPALWMASDGSPDTIGIVSVFEPPFTVAPLSFGVAFISSESFARGLVDAAIDALGADGSLDDLIAEYVVDPAHAR